MAGPARLIDKNERTRKKPMRVLVLGMCRTGTTSISAALRKLGYTPHQMREVLVNPKEVALWQEAINTTLLAPRDRPSKQRNMAPYGKAEFDKLLGDYDAVMDLPGCVFAKELIDAYPEAKVVLTTRKYDEWEHSMRESIWCLCTWRLFAAARYFNITQLAPVMRLIHSVFRVHSGSHYGGPQAKVAYEKHYDIVRSSVPKDRLLEIDPDTIQWDPLCNFLEVDVPNQPYPKMNEEKAMRKNLEKAWNDMVNYLSLMLTLPAGVMFLCWVAYNNADTVRQLRDDWILTPLSIFMEDSRGPR
jgi:hypothetical protein